MLFLFMYMFFSGLVVFCLLRKHLLLTLLSLEYLVLIMFMGLMYYLFLYLMEMFFLLMFLTFSVCEGVLGLSILVLMIRLHGNDMISSISYMLW